MSQYATVVYHIDSLIFFAIIQSPQKVDIPHRTTF